jgi:hypothetical protein
MSSDESNKTISDSDSNISNDSNTEIKNSDLGDIMEEPFSSKSEFEIIEEDDTEKENKGEKNQEKDYDEDLEEESEEEEEEEESEEEEEEEEEESEEEDDENEDEDYNTQVPIKLKEIYKKNKCDKFENYFEKKCNQFLLEKEELERKYLEENPEDNIFLYPMLNDPNFNIKISLKKEFSDTKYDGEIYDIKEQADILNNGEFELSPHQAFVKNFLSFQTPYNSLLLFHGLGTGKTCSAIGVSEEMRDYSKQLGITKKIIIVASPNVQDNFRLQLFDERKLKLIDGIWNIKSCIGNKFLKEINPMMMKGLPKDKVVSQINSIINSSYLFLGYVEFGNYIVNKKIGKRSAKENKLENKNQKEGQNSEESKKIKYIKNLQNEFNNRLIIIDEVHNIRISGVKKNKVIAQNLLDLVTYAKNVRLLLLSATPMYNSYKEIIWLLNIMNINDKRGYISLKDVFDNNGDFKVDENNKEIGKELLINKSTGYVSFVRGENPYTFPFRVYPNIFSPSKTFIGSIMNFQYLQNQSDVSSFDNAYKYPTIQFNNKLIESKPIEIISLYLNEIKEEQEIAYNIIKLGKKMNILDFESLDTFSYNVLEVPLEALNIIYPIDNLKSIYENFNNNSNNKNILSSESNNISLEESENSNNTNFLDISQELSGGATNDENDENDENDINIESDVLSELEPESNETQNKSKYFNYNTLTGVIGLKRLMVFEESTSPAKKGDFEYKDSTIEKYGRIFSYENIGKYSCKIKSILDNILLPFNNSIETKIADGVILIYSKFIDAGLVPVALALEEVGFLRYKTGKSLFKNTPSSQGVEPKVSGNLKYIMITGDKRFSPNNKEELNALTNVNNKNGDQIKIALISQAGAEGLDFKYIRQVHVLEPWYNMNRIEQIIGRAVRNGSHKDLPFEKRNVQIFLHGTILTNKMEEAIDLYVYRSAEYKAIKIGKISRVLKENAIDCIINHEQTNFSYENILKQIQNKKIKPVEQLLSNGMLIQNFPVGDLAYSSTCDYMESCNYSCIKQENIENKPINLDTYNETFILTNSDKIIQKIKNAMKQKFFYLKKDLISILNFPKVYPIIQIYAALTYIINEKEIIIDRYNRSGYLVNIGDYYLFQPIELNDKNISILERSTPLDYKNREIKINIKGELFKTNTEIEEIDIIDLPEKNYEYQEKETRKNNLEEEPNNSFELEIEPNIERPLSTIEQVSLPSERIIQSEIQSKRNDVLSQIYKDYDFVMSSQKDILIIPNKYPLRGNDNWLTHAGYVITKLLNPSIEINMISYGFTLDILLNFLLEHLVDNLSYKEKLSLIQYLYTEKRIKKNSIENRIKNYFDNTLIVISDDNTCIVLCDDKTKNIFILNQKWEKATEDDKYYIQTFINEKYDYRTNEENKSKLNDNIGFIENNLKVFKIINNTGKKFSSFRCDQSGKDKRPFLNNILGVELFTKENTKNIFNDIDICIIQEFVFRLFNKMNKDNKVWFLNTEIACFNNF